MKKLLAVLALAAIFAVSAVGQENVLPPQESQIRLSQSPILVRYEIIYSERGDKTFIFTFRDDNIEVVAKCAGMVIESHALAGFPCLNTPHLLGKIVKVNYAESPNTNTLNIAYKKPDGTTEYETLWVISETILSKK